MKLKIIASFIAALFYEVQQKKQLDMSVRFQENWLPLRKCKPNHRVLNFQIVDRYRDGMVLCDFSKVCKAVQLAKANPGVFPLNSRSSQSTLRTSDIQHIWLARQAFGSGKYFKLS